MTTGHAGQAGLYIFLWYCTLAASSTIILENGLPSSPFIYLLWERGLLFIYVSMFSFLLSLCVVTPYYLFIAHQFSAHMSKARQNIPYHTRHELFLHIITTVLMQHITHITHNLHAQLLYCTSHKTPQPRDSIFIYYINIRFYSVLVFHPKHVVSSNAVSTLFFIILSLTPRKRERR